MTSDPIATLNDSVDVFHDHADDLGAQVDIMVDITYDALRSVGLEENKDFEFRMTSWGTTDLRQLRLDVRDAVQALRREEVDIRTLSNRHYRTIRFMVAPSQE